MLGPASQAERIVRKGKNMQKGVGVNDVRSITRAILLEAIASSLRLEAIASRLEAIALRLEA